MFPMEEEETEAGATEEATRSLKVKADATCASYARLSSDAKRQSRAYAPSPAHRGRTPARWAPQTGAS